MSEPHENSCTAQAWTAAIAAALASMAALAMLRAGGALLAGDPATLYASIDFNAAPFEDLLGPYWRTAASVLDGEAVPDRQYLYPATLAVLLAPLTALGPGAGTAAAALSGATTLAALLLAALLASPARSAREAATFGVLAGAAFPLIHGVYWANAGAPCATVALLGWVLAARGDGRAGGALIGVAAAVKLTPLLLVAGLAACGRGRALRWAAGTFIALAILLPLLVLGPDGFRAFHLAAREQLHALVELTSTPEGARGAQDLRSFGIRLGLGSWGWALTLLGLAGWARWAIADIVRGRAAGGIWLLLVAVIVIRPCWAHGLAWLPAAWWFARGGGPAARRLIALSMIAASYPVSWLFETPTEFLRASGPLVAAGLAAAALALASGRAEPAQATQA